MNEATNKWTEKPPRRGIFSGLRGFFLTTVLLAGLLYCSVYVIGLMDGFRAFLEDHLKASLDLRVKISKAWLTPALNLEFDGLTISSSRMTTWPRTMVATGQPVMSIPSKGVQPERVAMSACFRVRLAFRSTRVRSPSQPLAMRPLPAMPNTR